MVDRLRKFKHFINICSWLLGGQLRKRIIFSSGVQLVVSALDFIFLTLVFRYIQMLQERKNDNEISLHGHIYVNMSQIFILILMVMILKSALSFFVRTLTLETLAKREAGISAMFVKSSVFEKIDSSNSHNSADLLQTCTNLIRSIFIQLFQPIIAFTNDLASLAWMIFAILFFTPKIALFVIPILGIFTLIITLKIGRYQEQYSKLSLTHGREALRLFSEIRVGNVYLKLNGSEEYYLRQLFTERYLSSRFTAIARNIQAIPVMAIEFFLVVSVGVVVLVESHNQGADSTIGVLGLFVAASFKAIPSLNGVISFYSAFKQFGPSLLAVERMGARFNLSDLESWFNTNVSERSKTDFGGDLIVDNLSYRYPNSSVDVLANFNMIIPEGKVVVIQGPSGSGKSTLLALTLGLLTPTNGQILIRKNEDFEPLGDSFSGIGYLGQDVRLLDESFGYNIALRPITDLDHQKLVDVLSLVGLLERVDREPGGVNALIGENGCRISIGERQRLGIARALFYSPKLIILDEPTSNLDPIAEQQVWAALQKIKGAVSMLIVSHREVPSDLYDSKINLGNTESASRG